MNKIKVFHFHNGSGGGVLSVIQNLILYQQDETIEQNLICTINNKQPPAFKIQSLKRVVNEQFFYYSPDWNFYYTCRQLSKLLPDEQSVIIAHDWLELGLVSHLGINNPVVLIVHGDYKYYYELAVKHADHIDVFICIAEGIAEKLKKLLPERENDIYYQRFPVRDPAKKTKFSGIKKILFVGRCEDAKGYSLLPVIEKFLNQLNYKLEWSIIGSERGSENVRWPDGSIVHFLKEIPNEEVLKLLPEHDLILLPSLAEGMPVSVIEAMKAGVIPVVNDIPGGIQELVENSVTGFKIKNNDPAEYALTIIKLYNNSDLVNQLGLNCINRGTTLFNPIKNTQAFELLYKQASKQNRKKEKRKIYGSRLDEPWIPNVFVSQIRKLVKK